MSALNVAEVVKESLWHLDAELEKEGWDAPPRLLMMLPTTVEDVGLAIQIKPLTGWDVVVPMANSAQRALGAMVHVYAEMPTELLRGGIPENLFALAFVSESWMLKVDYKDEGAAASALKAGREHKINEDSRRVEARVIYLQPVGGPSAMLMHERDGVVELQEGDTAGGEIPRLLAELVAALTR